MANVIGQIKGYHGGAKTIANIYDAKQITIGEGETKILMHFDSSATRDECGNTWTATNGYMNCNGASYIVSSNYSSFELPLVFTMEAWIYSRQWKGDRYGEYSFPIVARWNHGSSTLWLFGIWGDSTTGKGKITMGFGAGSGSGGVAMTLSSASVPLNQWSHIAVSRDSNGLIRFFCNGALIGSGTCTNVPSNGSAYTPTIGASSNGVAFADGYIDDVRVSHGICRYTANFTPPARGSISRDGYTKALLKFDSSVTADECGNTWTASGSPTISGVATLSSAQYKFGVKSLYLDGSSYLKSSNVDAFNFGTGDFTIDWWCYLIAKNVSYPLIFSTQYAASGYGGLCVHYFNGQLALFMDNQSQRRYIGGSIFGTLPLNEWHHFAVVKSGTNVYGFKDGVKTVLSTTYTDSVGVGDGIMYIGAQPWNIGWYYWYGYIDEFRIVKGKAVWTSNFTPPTSAYTKTSGITAVNANMLIRHGNTNGYIPLTTDAEKTTKPYLAVRHGSINYYAIK